LKKFRHLRLHCGIHLDERWPFAFETFARNFLRRVDAEFAAVGDFGGGVIERVGLSFDQKSVAPRVRPARVLPAFSLSCNS